MLCVAFLYEIEGAQEVDGGQAGWKESELRSLLPRGEEKEKRVDDGGRDSVVPSERQVGGLRTLEYITGKDAGLNKEG